MIEFVRDLKYMLHLHFRLATSPATASGEDFVSKTVDVTFEPGETGPKQVEFEIVDDKLVENTESFIVSVVSSSVPAITSGEPATVNIRDNDGNNVCVNVLLVIIHDVRTKEIDIQLVF